MTPTLPLRARWTRAALSIAFALGLAGCGSSPMPAARSSTNPGPAKPLPSATTRVASAMSTPSAAAAPAPAESRPAQPAAKPDASLPYSAAVAARFPDPPVHYPTPAFQPGRTAFTSNAELQAYVRSLVRGGSSGTKVQLVALGASQSGVPLEALVFTRAADGTPEAIQRSGRPTVMLVGQQHGDEPAGSEALLHIAHELARGRLEHLLDRINVVMLPRANPDGAPTANRVSASGVDINRDHLLLRTPEAQAIATLAREFRPVVVVDSHEYSVVGRYLEKFGAIQRFDALVQYAMTANLPEFITRASEEWFRQPLLGALKAEGLSTEWYYTTPTSLDDKRISMGGIQPDTGRNVNGLKNAVSFLIETRGVGLGRTHFKRRVHTHVTALNSLLLSTAGRADDLVKLRAFVDNDVSSRACQGEAVVEAAATPSEYTLVMIDPHTGLDKPLAVSWDSALELRPVKTRARPCGYWLSADQGDAVRRLRALGVTVQQLAGESEMRGEIYRETSREETLRPDVRGTIADAGTVVKVQVQTVPALLDVKAGSYYVPLDQPLANLVIAAMEPDTQNSYLTSGIVTGVDGLARVLARPNAKFTTLP